jgi:hypothetical protein
LSRDTNQTAQIYQMPLKLTENAYIMYLNLALSWQTPTMGMGNSWRWLENEESSSQCGDQIGRS